MHSMLHLLWRSAPRDRHRSLPDTAVVRMGTCRVKNKHGDLSHLRSMEIDVEAVRRPGWHGYDGDAQRSNSICPGRKPINYFVW